MILSVAINQFIQFDLISNEMLLSFIGLQHTRLAWHDPQNSYTRPRSITEHLTVSLNTRLKYFTIQEKNIFRI